MASLLVCGLLREVRHRRDPNHILPETGSSQPPGNYSPRTSTFTDDSCDASALIFDQGLSADFAP